jgi:hypothetical protein
MNRKNQLYHLLKPKEFRVWCIGDRRPPGPAMKVTSLPSKTTCVNCLTSFRYAKGHRSTNGNCSLFRVKWVNGRN